MNDNLEAVKRNRANAEQHGHLNKYTTVDLGYLVREKGGNKFTGIHSLQNTLKSADPATPPFLILALHSFFFLQDESLLFSLQG